MIMHQLRNYRKRRNLSSRNLNVTCFLALIDKPWIDNYLRQLIRVIDAYFIKYRGAKKAIESNRKNKNSCAI